jgi:hypothetical protein
MFFHQIQEALRISHESFQLMFFLAPFLCGHKARVVCEAG